MQRRLAAILALDAVGFSSLMAADEARALNALTALRREVIDPAVADNNGRLIKLMGDGALVEFGSAVDAAECAARIQRENAPRAEAEGGIALRIGVNLGDVVVDGDDLYGDGVNVAARLEAEAAPGGVLISDDMLRQLRGRTALRFIDLGEKRLKNIPEPVRVHSLADAAAPSGNAFEALTGAKPQAPDKPSVAVLPLDNMGADPEQEYFADGITEDIITELSRFPGLLVIARNSTFSFKGRARDIRTVARELGVRFVVEGSVRRAGNRVRVTAQLIEAETGNHVWAERYDRDLEDIFAVQEDITSAVVASIAPQIDRAEIERARRRPDVDISAYDMALQAEAAAYDAFRAGSADLLLKSVDLDEAALSLDPRCARALWGQAMALGYCYLYRWGPDPDAALAAAWAKCERLFEIDASNPGSYLVRGMLRQFRGDNLGALDDLRRGVELNPNFTRGLFTLAWAESLLGEAEAARSHVETGLRLSPREDALWLGIAYLALAQASFADGDNGETRRFARVAVQMMPRAPIRRALLISGCTHDGDMCEAREHRRILEDFAPDFLPSLIAGRVTLYGAPEINARLVEGLKAAVGAV